MSATETTLEARLTGFWSVELPARLDPWAPRWAEAFADGSWTASWKGVAAFAPLVGFAVGFLGTVVWPGVTHVYTESLALMAFVMVAAILSGPVGVLFLAGYVVADLLALQPAGTLGANPFEVFLRRGGSRLIAYVLLALPAMRLPLLARRMTQVILLRFWPTGGLRAGLRAVSDAAGCGLLVFLWCLAMVPLIRPVFTWMGTSPTVAAIRPVQEHWEWLVGLAMGAALVRVALEELTLRLSPRATVVAELRRRRGSGHARRGDYWTRLPAAGRIGVSAGLVTLLLSGLYTGWLDALLVAATLTLLAAWRDGKLGGVPVRWARAVRQVPSLVRFAAAPLLGYLLAELLLGWLWGTGSFRPVMAAALVTLALFYVLFPRRPLEPDS